MFALDFKNCIQAQKVCSDAVTMIFVTDKESGIACLCNTHSHADDKHPKSGNVIQSKSVPKP
jgi:hypothetical protein